MFALSLFENATLQTGDGGMKPITDRSSQRGYEPLSGTAFGFEEAKWKQVWRTFVPQG